MFERKWNNEYDNKSLVHLLCRCVMEMFVVFKLVSILMFVGTRHTALVSVFV